MNKEKKEICARCRNIVSKNKKEISKGYYAYCKKHDEDLYKCEVLELK